MKSQKTGHDAEEPSMAPDNEENTCKTQQQDNEEGMAKLNPCIEYTVHQVFEERGQHLQR